MRDLEKYLLCLFALNKLQKDSFVDLSNNKPAYVIVGGTGTIDEAIRAQVNFTVRYTIRPGAQYTIADRVRHFIWLECTRPIGYQANQ